MTRFTDDNTEGYSAADLAILNRRFLDEVYLPADATPTMDSIEEKSWHDHCAERVLADFDERTLGREWGFARS